MFGQGCAIYHGIRLYLRVMKRILRMLRKVRFEIYIEKWGMISVFPRPCDVSGNVSLPKGCETGIQYIPKGKD